MSKKRAYPKGVKKTHGPKGPQYIYDKVKLKEGPLDTPCWIWQRASTQDGYGQVCFMKDGRKHNWGAHRLSFYVHNKDKYRDDLVVMHKCDVKSCVNPDHLHQGTYFDNMKEARARGLLKCTLNERQVRDVCYNPQPVEYFRRKYNLDANVLRGILRRKYYRWVKIDEDRIVPLEARRMTYATWCKEHPHDYIPNNGRRGQLELDVTTRKAG